MERLSQEVVAKIGGYLTNRREGKRVQPALATLSRSWQYAIGMFRFKSFHTTSDDLVNFYPAFARHRTRRRFPRSLHLDIALTRYSNENCAK